MTLLLDDVNHNIVFAHMKPILTINLKVIQDNYRYIQSICGAEISAAVKADSYGLGADKIVPALYDAGCRKFFVATIE